MPVTVPKAQSGAPFVAATVHVAQLLRATGWLTEAPDDALQLALGQAAPGRLPRPLLGTLEVGQPDPSLALGHP